MLFALDRKRFSAMSSMEGREIPMIFSAVLTTFCTVFQSVSLQLPDQTDAVGQDALYCAPVECEDRRGKLDILRRKNKHFCPLFTKAILNELSESRYD